MKSQTSGAYLAQSSHAEVDLFVPSEKRVHVSSRYKRKLRLQISRKERKKKKLTKKTNKQTKKTQEGSQIVFFTSLPPHLYTLSALLAKAKKNQNIVSLSSLPGIIIIIIMEKAENPLPGREETKRRGLRRRCALQLQFLWEVVCAGGICVYNAVVFLLFLVTRPLSSRRHSRGVSALIFVF